MRRGCGGQVIKGNDVEGIHMDGVAFAVNNNYHMLAQGHEVGVRHIIFSAVREPDGKGYETLVQPLPNKLHIHTIPFEQNSPFVKAGRRGQGSRIFGQSGSRSWSSRAMERIWLAGPVAKALRSQSRAAD